MDAATLSPVPVSTEKLSTSLRLQVKMTLEPLRKEEQLLRLIDWLRALLRFGACAITAERIDQIRDEYYDNDAMALHRLHSFVRVRFERGGKRLSLKKSERIYDAGFIEWEEITAELSDSEYQQQVNQGFAAFAAGHFRALGAPLRKILELSSTRNIFTIQRGPEEYRLCIDRFTARAAGKQSRPRAELEVEALNDAARSQLADFGRNLFDVLERDQFRFADSSKYDRAVKYFELGRSWWNGWLLDFLTQHRLSWAQCGLGILVPLVLGLLLQPSCRASTLDERVVQDPEGQVSTRKATPTEPPARAQSSNQGRAPKESRKARQPRFAAP